MKKLIEYTQENIIECDNNTCDYVIPNPTKDHNVSCKEFINKSCPNCGYNLLTTKDYLDGEKVNKIINRINFWLGWLAYFIPKKYETNSTLKVHNGVTIKTNNFKTR